MRKHLGYWPLVVVALTAAPVAAQRTGAAEGGELHRQHGSIEQLLLAVERAHSLLYEQLLTEPNASTERLDQEFANRMLADVRASNTAPAATPNLARLSPRLVRVMERTYALQREVYDILSDASITDKAAAVDAAVDRYLAEPEVALSPYPKSMEIMDEQVGSMVFREKYPRTAALYWSFRWVQLGGSEPLMFYPTQDEQHTGVEATISRFREMLENPPETSPSHMPMAPTVAPELVSRHVRAAAIFDNLNMLHDVVGDILADPSITNKGARIDEVIDLFVDPDYLKEPVLDWIRMALRHGIYAQGGPAIGRLDRPERNAGHDHGGQRHIVIMPGG